MTPSELKYHVETAGHETYFFTRKTMAFFGDTMKNYGVRDGGVIMSEYDVDGNWIGAPARAVPVWELYHKRPVKHGLQGSAFFDKVSFKVVHKE